MATSDPLEAKKVRVQGFDSKAWEKQSEKIMESGLQLKFEQNKELRDYLVHTGSHDLVEASPKDTTWGIGMGFKDKSLMVKEKWGKNKLGCLLMKLREDYKKTHNTK